MIKKNRWLQFRASILKQMFVRDRDNPIQSRKKSLNKIYFPTNPMLNYENNKQFFLIIININ